ncbi:hypothetical protein BGX26_003242 [Mortierella sp. AD094]|nr:hypothetical protein BGX26_003242 [Mortierella sp. AD094]
MKIPTILTTLAAALLVTAVPAPAPAPANVTPSLPVKPAVTVPDTYIIEYQDGVKHNTAQNALKAHGVNFKIRNVFNVFNGASVTVNSNHDSAELAKIPGVKKVYQVTVLAAPKINHCKTNPSDPQATSSHHMTGVDILQNKYHLTGKGIKIGVIDSGVDYTHPAFAAKGASAGCFARYGKSCRVKYGWDFVGDNYDGTNTPAPDYDPMDCSGHGTHLASIVGGGLLSSVNGTKLPQPFVGVAPEVTLGAYRIFGCSGSTTSDVVLAAMELAFNDGMDVITLAVDGATGNQSDPIAVLGDKLIALGMAVTASAGDQGGQSYGSVNDASLGTLSTSVGSFDNEFEFNYSFNYSGANYPYIPSTGWNRPFNFPGAILSPKFNLNNPPTFDDGCSTIDLNASNSKGKIVLVSNVLIYCDLNQRITNAINAGALGILIQSASPGFQTLDGYGGFPVATVGTQAAVDLVAAWNTNNSAVINWSKATIVKGAGAPSDFSSYGLDYGIVKPDIGAPGGNILSAFPVKMGGYAVLSGTAQAASYVAGSHALYMQAKHAKSTGDVIRLAFKNTGTISSDVNSAAKVSVSKQGSGLLNVLSAVLTTTSITPDSVSLLSTDLLRTTVKITIKNSGKRTETYTLSHIPADALSWNENNIPLIDLPVIKPYYATVDFSSKKVEVSAGKSVDVTLTFAEPKDGSYYEGAVYSGFIVATPLSKDGIPVHMPYSGLKAIPEQK